MNDTALINLKVNLTLLNFLNSLSYIHSYSTTLRIRDNAKEFIATIIKLKPSSAKGTYIKSIYLSSTMSKGIKIDPKTVEEN